MPRSPSPDLTNWLLAHQICTHRDIRRCESHVRRLAADLPPFDSVWLDALVQLGRLTPFQGRILESRPYDDLRLGPCLLVDECSAGLRSTTWRARLLTSGETVAAKLIAGPVARGEHQSARWQQLIQSLPPQNTPQSPPGICGPTQLLDTTRGPVLLSPWIEGPSLRELAIQIGRFPVAVVAAVGRQILESLVHLERCRVVHGDLRLENLRLNRVGQVVMVDTGIRPILEPEPTVHSRLDPDRFDGTAPELIGSTQLPSPRSELYALGCLLWQLLVGRPPFPAGDPLVKLAHHQSREVPDLRDLAPETPPALAQAVQLLTSRHPAARPESATSALRDWPQLPHESTAILQRFHRDADHPQTLPHSPRTHRRLTMAAWGSLGLAVFAASALGWSAKWHTLWPTIPVTSSDPTSHEHQNRERDSSQVRLAAHNVHSMVDSLDSVSAANESPRTQRQPSSGQLIPHQNDSLRLPDPDRRGRLQLQNGQTYTSRDLSVVGPLQLECDDGAPARILVTTPCELVAASISIRNVLWDLTAVTGTEDSGTGAALNLRTQRVDLTSVSCRGAKQPGSSGSLAAILRWELVDERDIRSSRMKVEQCAFRDGGTALLIPQPVGRLEFEQTLFERNDAAVEFAGSARRIPPVVLQGRHVTARNLGNLVRWWGEDGPPSGVRLEIDFHDSVFHLRNEDAAVCQVVSSRYTNEWIPRLRLVGEGNLLVPGRTVARWQSDQTAESIELDSPDLVVEGLMVVPFEFVSDEGAMLQPLAPLPGLALRRTTPPGCDAARLPD